jgi:hypothetical protein
MYCPHLRSYIVDGNFTTRYLRQALELRAAGVPVHCLGLQAYTNPQKVCNFVYLL